MWGLFTWIRDAGHRLALLTSLALAAPATAIAEPPADEATPMYARGALVVVDLTLPPASVEALGEEPEEYQPGTFSLAFTDGSPDGVGPASTPIEVGVRLKGGLGSFRTLAAKAAFKLKINQVKGQKFLGLKKMTLNNMVQDPSMIHEALSYELFRAAGVPAPRTGYAYVRVNGDDYGLYLNIETFDDVALERWFGPFDDPQHLYEGEYGTDLMPGGAGAFEVDEGDGDDRSDLEALIAALADEDAPFTERVSGLANLEEMTRMWAVEKYIGHWDGYSGGHGPLLPNNFYLYSSASGEFQMLPWGTDNTWDEPLEFDGEGGVLFNRCLADSECRALYREALVAVGQAAAGLELDSIAREAAELLAPWQQLAPAREEHDLEEIQLAVDEVREFIATRPEELNAWLDPSSLANGSPADSDGGEEPPDRAPHTPMRLGRIAIAGDTLVTQLTVPAAGQVSQRVEIRTVNGDLGACTAQQNATGAGSLIVRCGLSAAIQRRRRARWLKLNVTTRFKVRGRALESTFRRVLLPRVLSPARP